MTSHPADRLLLYISGEMDAGDAAAVARHLAGCPACAAEAERLRGVTARLEVHAAGPLPAGFTERVIAASALNRSSSRVPIGWLAALAAALVAGVAVGVGWSVMRDRSAAEVTAAGEPQYMLVLLEPVAERLAAPPDEGRARGRRMGEWVAAMRRERILVDGERLRDEGGRVVSRAAVEDRVGHVPDGELFTGYMLIRADSYDQATAIASSCPILAHGGRVAVRALR